MPKNIFRKPNGNAGLRNLVVHYTECELLENNAVLPLKFTGGDRPSVRLSMTIWRDFCIRAIGFEENQQNPHTETNKTDFQGKHDQRGAKPFVGSLEVVAR